MMADKNAILQSLLQNPMNTDMISAYLAAVQQDQNHEDRSLLAEAGESQVDIADGGDGDDVLEDEITTVGRCDSCFFTTEDETQNVKQLILCSTLIEHSVMVNFGHG